MKYGKFLAVILAMALLAGCAKGEITPETTQPLRQAAGEFLVNGETVGTDPTAAVYAASDIIYYESGKDFKYGEGTEKDAHTAQEAAAHTVVHITKPGTYRLSGTLSKGQVAVDLGEDAKKDPNAVVTLVLDGVDITCQVAPAVIFYNVYECGDDENPTKDVDTSKAGANVVLEAGSENKVSGSYVAKIYKPDSVALNAAGTKVEDAKKLHKYDGAFYSKMSMNVGGEGSLFIRAENEGLDSELHLTINSGKLRIESGNDGINTNEDGVSVTTVNGGELTILVTGETGEGDGIDSNGWLVVNGGKVTAAACAKSGDAGIDSDMGIHINGGTVIATGNMLDRIEDGGQTHAVFNFAQKQQGTETVTLKDESGKVLLETVPKNAYSILIYSSPELQPGTYTLWSNGQQLAGGAGGSGGFGGFGGGRPGMKPDGMQRPGGFDGTMQQPPAGEVPEGTVPAMPEGMEPPEGTAPVGEPPEGFQGQRPDRPQDGGRKPEATTGVLVYSPNFEIREGSNQFSGISIYQITLENSTSFT